MIFDPCSYCDLFQVTNNFLEKKKEFEYDADEDKESMTEFSLPMDDYDQLIAEHRKEIPIRIADRTLVFF